MTYYLGIDAGGSTTRAAVCDASGTILSRGVGGPANYLHTERNLFIDSLTTALYAALPVPASGMASVCIGMAGLGRQCDRQSARSVLSKITPLFDSAEITHDARIAWAGATALAPGIVLISGTGSIAYGVDAEGKEHRAGGYGPHYSDEGSGFHMGRQAVKYCLRVADGRSDHSLLVDLTCRRLGVSDAHELAAAIASDCFSRQEISLLTEVIRVAHRQGDENAGAIIARASGDLADLIFAVARNGAFTQNGAAQVALSGGTLKAVPELAAMVTEITKQRLGAAVVKGALSPLGGALLIAMSAGGLTVNPQAVDNLRAHGEGGV
ncbi:MAG TPA: BadF/BadG/BcrA/BcrD ATPase family protein [Bacillota bacterium]|nr:BadF/BadG/BcrA/BcrD ATPase family protein [Bacillota bacterium]